MKKTIVLKNLKSNIVEEAIIVFKENVAIKEKQLVKGEKEKEGSNDEDNIAIREAENVILDYIEDCKEEEKRNIQKTKMSILKVMNISLVILFVFAVIF